MQNRGSSKIEKEIAEAKLDVILKSKEKPPHNRRHRIASLETEGSGSSNIFNDDITFEKYEMGNDGKKEKGSKARNDDVASVKFNHKARGSAKEKIENEAGKDQMDNIHF
ncbi:hypothetical protein GALMADRAFT_246558 [Galerina marginata CBS 339.88]|uniref:Uncharacterized protein n=1 Tax=Galerina marginata (strain CBS 339.88) TaxID=685588 RepID=A0A067TBH3_GALM3|nr:hypothetical protein GALMADRAFT_246558 [Galerina marginata CBS 339.88]